jgi:hypothetical protein
MDEELLRVMDEAVRLEQNVADLYLVFHHAFQRDADFWWRLTFEEQGHAALIRGARGFLRECSGFPDEGLLPTLQDLRECNKRITLLLQEYREKPPGREQAFSVAVELEESAGEAHFQLAMECTPSSKTQEVFQSLNRDDRDHADRIRAYMREAGLGA